MARKPPPVVAWSKGPGEGELRLVMRCRKVVDGMLTVTYRTEEGTFLVELEEI